MNIIIYIIIMKTSNRFDDVVELYDKYRPKYNKFYNN